MPLSNFKLRSFEVICRVPSEVITVSTFSIRTQCLEISEAVIGGRGSGYDVLWRLASKLVNPPFMVVKPPLLGSPVFSGETCPAAPLPWLCRPLPVNPCRVVHRTTELDRVVGTRQKQVQRCISFFPAA